ncbi:MAG: CDP-diacylglycerol--glycerol-3-phosphate 3-phosphatidyltransferase, partial [Erysipelotrichaceae bacterium]|nr:CDP-diacylglycerol--glycerol-3-phosphate 3-phosphatidyltransferase [Erysipelotrichaceae bacterium]
MNLPNKLTLFRILLVPVCSLVWLFPYESVGINLGYLNIGNVTLPVLNLIVLAIFCIASFTDYLDGQIARKNNLVTTFGKFADPLADKMLVMAAFIMLVPLDLAPAWVIAVIVCRELAVTGLRLLLVEQGGVVMAAAL